MARECCPTHGLIMPCHDCEMIAMANAVCPDCKAPTGVHDVLDDGTHSDGVECSAMLGSPDYRREEISKLELDPADYPIPDGWPEVPAEPPPLRGLAFLEHLVANPAPTQSVDPDCGVLGCYLPKDENYPFDDDAYFHHCTLHGQSQAEKRALREVWRARIIAAHKKAGLCAKLD